MASANPPLPSGHFTSHCIHANKAPAIELPQYLPPLSPEQAAAPNIPARKAAIMNALAKLHICIECGMALYAYRNDFLIPVPALVLTRFFNELSHVAHLLAPTHFPLARCHSLMHSALFQAPRPRKVCACSCTNLPPDLRAVCSKCVCKCLPSTCPVCTDPATNICCLRHPDTVLADALTFSSSEGT